jgi:hypothetical protein
VAADGVRRAGRASRPPAVSGVVSPLRVNGPRSEGVGGGADAKASSLQRDAPVKPGVKRRDRAPAESTVPSDLYFHWRCSVRVWSGEPRHLGRAWQGRIGSAVFESSRTAGESSTADGVAASELPEHGGSAHLASRRLRVSEPAGCNRLVRTRRKYGQRAVELLRAKRYAGAIG